MNDLVSILMPMKNAEHYVSDSIKSVLSQTHKNLELIIINDQSDDNSQAIVNSFLDDRIKLIQGTGKGISAALNRALDNAKGSFVCRCDADDLFPKERLKIQLDWLAKHADYIAVAAKFSSMDDRGAIISAFNTGDSECDITQDLLCGKTRTHLGTYLIKSSSLKKMGGFRDYFVTAEDIDFQLRLAEFGSIGYIPDNMYFYRLHNSSITHVQSSNKRVFFENIARDFLKQRLETGEDQLQSGSPPDPPALSDTPIDSEEQISGYMLSESWKLHSQKQKLAALQMAFRLCMRKPFFWKGWRNLALILIKI